MTREFEVSFADITFVGECDYVVAEAATNISPSWPSSVYIETIYVKGCDVNLVEVIKQSILEELENQVLQSIEGY